MPKKTKNTQDADSIGRIAADLDALAATVRTVEAMMRIAKIDSLEIGRFRSLVEGMHKLEVWVADARRAMLDVKTSRGDYTASGDTVSDSGDTNQPAGGHRGTKTPKRGTPKRKKP